MRFLILYLYFLFLSDFVFVFLVFFLDFLDALSVCFRRCVCL